MDKEKKEQSMRSPLIIFFILLLSLPIIEEALFILQDTFVKPPLYKLKNEQFDKINKRFANYTIKKVKSLPKPLSLSDLRIERGKNTRKELNVEFSKRRRPNWMDQYKPQKMIGFGQHGTTYLSCVNSENNCVYVIKCSRPFDLQKGKMRSPTILGNQLIVNEVFALLDIARAKNEVKMSVPIIYDFFSEVDVVNGEETFYMVQEKFEKCYKPPTIFEKILARRGLGRWSEDLRKMKKEMEILLSNLNDYGWIHLDFHEDNILCRIDEKKRGYIIIDWALSFCIDDTMDSMHPISMYTGNKQDMTYEDMLRLQRQTLDKWYRTVMEHSSFGSLEQKRRNFK